MSVLRAKESFVAAQPNRKKGSTKKVVNAGELVMSDDPVVKGREDLFEAPEASIERATARPGERRQIVISEAIRQSKQKKDS